MVAEGCTREGEGEVLPDASEASGSRAGCGCSVRVPGTDAGAGSREGGADAGGGGAGGVLKDGVPGNAGCIRPTGWDLGWTCGRRWQAWWRRGRLAPGEVLRRQDGSGTTARASPMRFGRTNVAREDVNFCGDVF